MTIAIYIIFIIIGGFLFFFGLCLLQHDSTINYILSAIMGSVGILCMGVLLDAYFKVSKDISEEDKIIKECNDYLENNKTIYMSALKSMEEFNKRGIKGIIDIRDEKDFINYRYASMIIHDYNIRKEKIQNINNTRFKRDATSVVQGLGGYLLGRFISKKMQGSK